MVDGEPAAFLLALPDWNPVLADLDGSPLRHPLRTLKHVLRTKAESLEGLRLITLGVKEPFRKRGIEGVLIDRGPRGGAPDSATAGPSTRGSSRTTSSPSGRCA